jgi:hypothetical protein
MNIVANTIVSKLFVGFVAVAMLVTVAAPARAATTDELQKMINDLLAQVASLQSQLGQGAQSVASGVCPYTWTRSLTMGSSGADVMKLQQFLNADVETRISASGVGSVGAETQYFGGLTAAAVSKFQTKYRSDVLSPAGLVNPTGYFGPSSMAKANMLCATGGVVGDTSMDDDDDDTMSDDDDDDSSSGSSGGSLQGEASLETFEIADGDDTEIQEGQEDAPVAEFRVEFNDGDAKITRIDIALVAQGSEEDPWDTFEDVSLWIDGDEVARENADDEDDYLDEDDGTIRFSGLDIVAREDDEVTIVVGVSVQRSVDNMPATWDISGEAIRFLDGDDVSTTENSVDELGDSTDFEITEEGSDDELKVKTSSSDPVSTTIQLEDDSKSDWTTIFAFDLDTEDSINDIEVNSLVVEIDVTEDGTTATSSALVISDVRITVGGDEMCDTDTTHDQPTGTASSSVDCDNGEFMIDAGDEVTVEVEVKFLQLAAALEGATVEARVDSANLEAEGADDLAGSQLSGASTGDEHTLRTEGAILEFSSASESLKANSTSDVTDDEGVFTLKFDVTAFETDLYVNKTAASGTAQGTGGVNYRVLDSNGDQINQGTSSASLTSTAETEGTQFKVAEGETKEFTLSVNYDPTTQGFYTVQLYSLNFKNATGNPDNYQRALPAEDYETDPLSI